MSGRRVWITGLGMITPIGHGVDAFWRGAQAGRSPVRAIDRFDASQFRSRVAAQIDDFDPLDHVALIEQNDWADLSRITQVAGSRTYCLKGRLALLEMKLMAWALDRIAGAILRRLDPSGRMRANPISREVPDGS